jgi:hypothetical protein
MNPKLTHCFFIGKNILKIFSIGVAKKYLSVGIGERVKKFLSSDIEN